jgi:hypothetical protein
MSQLNQAADRAQASVEDAAAAVGNSLRIIRPMRLAFRQVVDRYGLGEPWIQIARDMDRIEHALRLAQAALRPRWEAGQASRWDQASNSIPIPGVDKQSPIGSNNKMSTHKKG